MKIGHLVILNAVQVIEDIQGQEYLDLFLSLDVIKEANNSDYI